VLEDHPAVITAAVVALEDEIKGMKPYAFVVTKDNISADQLTAYMLENLPASHCPRKIWFLENMPLNAVYKIDKVLLKQWAQERLSTINNNINNTNGDNNDI
jgi:acyl-coenzyme A synthetase/AMP-(fatty) acid ligase